MLLTKLIKVVTGALFAQIDNPQFKRAIGHLPRIKLIVWHVALILGIDPYPLILPVIRVEALKVVKKINAPTRATRCHRLASHVAASGA